MVSSSFVFQAVQYADAVKQAQLAENDLRKPMELNTLQKFIKRLRGIQPTQQFRIIGAPKEIKPLPALKPTELQDYFTGFVPT